MHLAKQKSLIPARMISLIFVDVSWRTFYNFYGFSVSFSIILKPDFKSSFLGKDWFYYGYQDTEIYRKRPRFHD